MRSMIITSADIPMIMMMMSDRSPPTTETESISAVGQWDDITSLKILQNTLGEGWSGWINIHQ